MTSDLVPEELDRCRALLSPRRTHVALEETAPLRPPESIGALAGLGFQARAPDVLVSVYVFAQWGGGSQAVPKLRDRVDMPDAVVQHGINGRLLFFGQARAAGPDAENARLRLADLITAFSGNE